MLPAILTWFYCLSITKAALLVLAVSMVYLVLHHYLNKKNVWRAAVVFLCLAWIIVIVAATLTDRPPGTNPAEPELLPFHSYRTVMAGENPELLRSNFMNAVLFYPAGLLGCDVLPGSWSRKWRVFVVVAFCGLLSLGIECAQYLFALGQAEVDDVIHNGLGALLGGTFCELRPRRTPSHKNRT